MSGKTDRKEAIRRHKDQKIPRGVFAVRCTTTGQAWIGSSPNLAAKKNRLWFELRHGGHRTKTLQTEWNNHGEATFTYEILEELDDDISSMRIRDVLAERKLHWMEQLGAEVL